MVAPVVSVSQAADLLLRRMKDAKFNFSQVAALSGTAQVLQHACNTQSRQNAAVWMTQIKRITCQVVGIVMEAWIWSGIKLFSLSE